MVDETTTDRPADELPTNNDELPAGEGWIVEKRTKALDVIKAAKYPTKAEAEAVADSIVGSEYPVTVRESRECLNDECDGEARARSSHCSDECAEGHSSTFTYEDLAPGGKK